MADTEQVHTHIRPRLFLRGLAIWSVRAHAAPAFSARIELDGSQPPTGPHSQGEPLKGFVPPTCAHKVRCITHTCALDRFEVLKSPLPAQLHDLPRRPKFVQPRPCLVLGDADTLCDVMRAHLAVAKFLQNPVCDWDSS